MEFNNETHVHVAADSVESLRNADVYRLLRECPGNHMAEFSAWLKEQRPDLASEVDACLNDHTLDW